MPSVCVVHLVWKPQGIETFNRFLSSYKQNKGSLDHQLLVVFNGFKGGHELDRYLELLEGISYSSFMLSRKVQDIPAYYAAARGVSTEFICFLNSYSVLLDEGWLTKLYSYIVQGDVGVVGATGSYQSLYCSIKESMQRARRRFILRRLAGSAWRRWTLGRLKTYFDPFPNPHIRSNAFMLARDLMLDLEHSRIHTKMEAMRFESGKNNLTRQIQLSGLKALVIGRNGKAYEQESWFDSQTYKSGDQSNLLVADNRTDQYAMADSEARRAMTKTAWGR
jgi:hypothetical protein